MRATLGAVSGAVMTAALLCSAGPVMAHHSFAAEYDGNSPVTLKGVVTKVEWTNPHARFYVDVKDENGTITNWNLELASPNVLARNGWTRKTLGIGDEVVVDGAKAKDGSHMANARTVKLADGRRVFAGSGEAPPPAAK
jgi:hypothetical protein